MTNRAASRVALLLLLFTVSAAASVARGDSSSNSVTFTYDSAGHLTAIKTSGNCPGGSGSCACSGVTVCGTCASWSFESGSAAPWAAMLDPIQSGSNGVTSVQSSTDRATSGSHSLKVSFNGSFAEVGTQLCSSSGSTYPLQNFSMTFDFYSDTFSGWVVAMAWNPTTGAWVSSSTLYTTPGSWSKITGTFNQAIDASYVGIYLSLDMGSFSGTAYIDNIFLAH